VQATGRVYRLGQQIGGSPLQPETSSQTFTLAEPDNLRLAAGADGIWGTVDDIYDNPAAYTNSITPVDLLPPATFQPRVCRVRLEFPVGSVAGRITFYNPTGVGQPLGPGPVPESPGLMTDPKIQNNVWKQPEAAPGAFVVIRDD